MTLTMHNTQYDKLWFFAYAAKEAKAALCRANMQRKGFKTSMKERNTIHRYNASSAIASGLIAETKQWNLEMARGALPHYQQGPKVMLNASPKVSQ